MVPMHDHNIVMVVIDIIIITIVIHVMGYYRKMHIIPDPI